MEKRRHESHIRRAEEQARDISQMIEGEEYYTDVLTQISAVSSALKSLALTLLDAYLHHCVAYAVKGDQKELDVKLEEASTTIARLAK